MSRTTSLEFQLGPGGEWEGGQAPTVVKPVPGVSSGSQVQSPNTHHLAFCCCNLKVFMRSTHPTLITDQAKTTGRASLRTPPPSEPTRCLLLIPHYHRVDFD